MGSAPPAETPAGNPNVLRQHYPAFLYLSNRRGTVSLAVHLMPLPPALTLPCASLGILGISLLKLFIFLLRLFLACFSPHPASVLGSFLLRVPWPHLPGLRLAFLFLLPRPYLPGPCLSICLSPLFCPAILLALQPWFFRLILILIRPRLPRKKIFICQGGPKAWYGKEDKYYPEYFHCCAPVVLMFSSIHIRKSEYRSGG